MRKCSQILQKLEFLEQINRMVMEEELKAKKKLNAYSVIVLGHYARDFPERSNSDWSPGHQLDGQLPAYGHLNYSGPTLWPQMSQ